MLSSVGGGQPRSAGGRVQAGFDPDYGTCGLRFWSVPLLLVLLVLLVLLALLVSPVLPVLPLQAHSREPLAQRRLAQLLDPMYADLIHTVALITTPLR